MERDYDYISDFLSDRGWGNGLMSTKRPEEFESTEYYSDDMTDDEYAQAMDIWLHNQATNEDGIYESDEHNQDTGAVREYSKILEILSNFGLSPKVQELFADFEQTAYYSSGMDDYEYAENFDEWFDTRQPDDNLYEDEDDPIHTKKWDRCTNHLQDDGKDMESAAAICSSSIKNAGVKSNHQQKKGKQYYANRKKTETNEATAAAGGTSTGAFSGPFMSTIKREINEALESAYNNGRIVTNEMLEAELDEGTGATAATTGLYEQPAIWAKDSKNMKFNKKTTIPGGSFVEVKEKCKKFPYCNQGDIDALNFSNPKVSKNSQLSENNDIYSKKDVMGTARKIKELEKQLFENYLKEEDVIGTEIESNEAHLKLPFKKKKKRSKSMKEKYYGTFGDQGRWFNNNDEPFNMNDDEDWDEVEYDEYEKYLNSPHYTKSWLSGPAHRHSKFLFNMHKDQYGPLRIRSRRNADEIEEVVNDELFRMYENKKRRNMKKCKLNENEYRTVGNNIQHIKIYYDRDGSVSSAGVEYYPDVVKIKTQQKEIIPVPIGDEGNSLVDEFRPYFNKKTSFNEAKEPGINEYIRTHKKSGETNKAGVKASMENAARLNKNPNKTEEEKLSAIGKGAPKYGNFDKEKFEKEQEQIDMLRGGGLEDIQFDTPPAKDYTERAEEAIEGSARMGNYPNYANAMRDFDGEKGDLGKRILKKAKKKVDMENKADEKQNFSMDIELPAKGKRYVATEGKIKDITLSVNEPIHYHKDIEQFLSEESKQDGQRTVVTDSKDTVYNVVWEGHNYYVESEQNDILKESELKHMSKLMGYKVGNYNKKPKSMKK